MNALAPLSKWGLASVEQYRALINATTDGSQPQEPYQRISQAVFEAGLRERCEKNPYIDLRFGWKAESVTESDEYAQANVTHLKAGQKHVFLAKYIIACDGASSRVRRDLGIPLDGGPT
jgi:FAD-dependent monooxygenase